MLSFRVVFIGVLGSIVFYGDCSSRGLLTTTERRLRGVIRFFLGYCWISCFVEFGCFSGGVAVVCSFRRVVFVGFGVFRGRCRSVVVVLFRLRAGVRVFVFFCFG